MLETDFLGDPQDPQSVINFLYPQELSDEDEADIATLNEWVSSGYRLEDNDNQ